MTNKKILVTSTDINMLQFNITHVLNFVENGMTVDVACSEVDNRIEELKEIYRDKVNVYKVNLSRSPFKLSNIKGYRQLKKIINQRDYDIVWTNEPVMGMMTRLAARKQRKKNNLKVYYLAHGFHFFKNGPIKSWLIFYPLEKFMTRFTDTIITITYEDYELSKKKFKRCNTEHIHGIGFNSAKYLEFTEEEKKKIRDEYGFKDDDKLILTVGEFNKNKNQIELINAMVEVVKEVPNAKVLFAGNGELQRQLENKVLKLHLENNIVFLGYRTDCERFVNIASLICSCSYREGLPMNIAEGMSLGKPVVASKNRGHSELVADGESGFIVSPKKPIELAEKIKIILKDEKLASQFGSNGKERVQDYNIEVVKKEIENIFIK